MNNVNNFAAIVDAVNHTSGRILDDHNNGASGMTVAGIAELVKGESRIPVVLCRSIYFSLNRLYLDERGFPHVSRESVGGVVKCMNGTTLEQGITNYNVAQVDQIHTCGTLENIHYLVDGKLVPEVTSLEAVEPQRTESELSNVRKDMMESILNGEVKVVGISEARRTTIMVLISEPVVSFSVSIAKRIPGIFTGIYAKTKKQFATDTDYRDQLEARQEFLSWAESEHTFNTAMATTASTVFAHFLFEDLVKTGNRSWSESVLLQSAEKAFETVLTLEFFTWVLTTVPGACYRNAQGPSNSLTVQLANLESMKGVLSKMWEMFDVPFPYSHLKV